MCALIVDAAVCHDPTSSAYAVMAHAFTRQARTHYGVLRFIIPCYLMRVIYTSFNRSYHTFRQHFVLTHKLSDAFRFDAYLRRCVKLLFTELAQVHWSVLGGVLFMQITIWLGLTHWSNNDRGIPYTVLEAISFVSLLMLCLHIHHIYRHLHRDRKFILQRVAAQAPPSQAELEARASFDLSRRISMAIERDVARRSMDLNAAPAPPPPACEPCPPSPQAAGTEDTATRESTGAFVAPAVRRKRSHERKKKHSQLLASSRQRDLNQSRKEPSTPAMSLSDSEVPATPLEEIVTGRHRRRMIRPATRATPPSTTSTAPSVASMSTTGSRSVLQAFKERLELNSRQHIQALVRSHHGEASDDDNGVGFDSDIGT